MYLIYSGVWTSAYSLVSREIKYFQTIAVSNLKKYVTSSSTDFQGDAAHFPDTITAQRGEWLQTYSTIYQQTKKSKLASYY